MTLVLDSATDAPARPTAKAPLGNDLKQKRKEELAAKAREKSERLAREKAARDAGAVESIQGAATGAEATRRAELVAKEDELIRSAEQKSKELAERFKVAMTQSY